jgi:CHASE3 domain sensor protein
MRSRATRSTFVAVAWIALGAAGYFLFTSQKTMTASASAVRATDLHAREADDAIADLRIGQQAYVASGQGVNFWMPKVAATVDTVNAALNALRQAAVSPDARTAAEQALAAIAEFVDVDKRARDYVRSGQTLMASDVIFTEGGQLTAVAARQVETARLAEHQAFDSIEGAVRRQQAAAIGASAGVAAVVALLLGLTGARSDDERAGQDSSALSSTASPRAATIGLGLDEGVVSHARPASAVGTTVPPVAAPPKAPAQARGAVVLRATADLSTDFGRVRDSEELSRLLARTADLLDASGLIVWMMEERGQGPAEPSLRPVLAHGYSETMLAKMPPMPRSADNAAAAACRTGTLQIVLSKPGSASGAVVAPILTGDGCVGALSAEIKSGGEGSEAVQAVAAIVAAHLATVLAAAPAETAAAEPPQAAAHG